MEYFQNRVDSFGPPRSKRTKASSSKQPTWPHPASFKATPETLAEAGFYFHPDSDFPDNVACFMCKKNLDGWEPDDDPFTIHYSKCRDSCAWAVVRCQRALDDEGFDFSDPTRHPTSKAMEKARLDTFSKARWPHDAVKGHGANSRAMAKAGFLCNSVEPGDDTALCLYCNLSLNGWDEDDDPYEEHVKRDKKNKTSCAFIKAYTGNALSKSTAKRPASKAASKPPTRSVSRSSKAAAAAGKEAPEEVTDSDDELAAGSSELTVLTKTSDSRASRASSARASSAAKTPGSRRSTRGMSTTGKTPGSRTVSSELEETDGGSESDAGRRTTKSRRKTGRQTKARVSAIVEEEDEMEPPKSTRGTEDVEMAEAEPEPEPQPEKKKRGRPPKSAAAKSTPKMNPKNEVEDEETGQELGAEPAHVPPAKKTHARTRSKANLEPDTDTVAPATSKGTHTRTKSTSKVKVKQEEGEDEASGVPAPAPKKKGKQRAPQLVEHEDEDPSSALPAKPKSKAVSRSKTKLTPKPEASDEDVASARDDGSHTRVNSGRSAAPRESQAASERKSSLSEDAGYATAEAPAEADQMEVDEEPAPPKPTKKAQVPAANAVQPVPRANSRPTPASSEVSQRPSPVIRSSSGAPPSSRASSSRPPSKLSIARAPTKDTLTVVEIDSDGEGSPERPPKPQSKAKAPASRQESTASVNGVKKPASQPSKKKLQVEVVVPPKTFKPVSSDDAQVQNDALASPPPRPPRSPDRPTKSEFPAPGTPASADYHSTHTSPERDAEGDGDVRMFSEADAAPAVSSSPRTYHPFLAQFPIEKLVGLTEEETEMTLEQYIRREMELQYAQMKADGERRIEEFKHKAAETRRLMETS
ncbi:hypothetical protein DICSQDRAFT_167803 [Dichomitus squalens LYAD-421 SS1]|uniref:uncharacterized protein n=1 Tax=Dichomitus squalens (strain LYAD-421) TaxID=732165 RepID=UPI0004413855|nr:uncharacterized protein DICSQDRAFT_167803 [Dichomitus squalens LYAD-421 SS1]EJF63753.1 hypothetical protein DICSQDRAFT_167803 [Dichomitus squalens LYAD-421 SS1]